MTRDDSAFLISCTKGSFAYAVRGADGVTLIDTSLPGRGPAILAELAGRGVAAGDIRRVLLTHHDVDHVGNAAFLQAETGCDIFIHPLDYPYLMEGKPRDGFKRVLGFLMRLPRPERVDPIDGDAIGDFGVIPTPGHTPGHVAYRFGDVLFVGDLVGSRQGRLTRTPGFLNQDTAAARESLHRLPHEGVAWLCPAHGLPVPATALAEFRRDL